MFKTRALVPSTLLLGSLFGFSACADDSSSGVTPVPGKGGSGGGAEAGVEAALGGSGGSGGSGGVEAGADTVVESSLDTSNDVPNLEDTQPEAQPEGGAGWTIETVDDAPKFKSRVALATTKEGVPHIAYNVASSADGWEKPSLWYATWENNAWNKTLVVDAQGISVEFPAIALNAAGVPNIVFNRFVSAENQVDVFLVTGDGNGGFLTPVNLTKTTAEDEWAAAVATDSNGTVHAVMQQAVEDPVNPPAKIYAIRYAQVQSGQSPKIETVAEGTAQFALNPEYGLAVESDGTVHAVYCKPGVNQLNNVLYYRKREGGTWGGEVALTDTSLDVWAPVVGVDSSKTVHIAYTIGADWDHKTLTYRQLVGGTPSAEQSLTGSDRDRSYYLGLLVGAEGTVHLAYGRLSQTEGGVSNPDLYYRKGLNKAFEPEERLMETPEADESTPSIALGPGGAPWIAFTENMTDPPKGKVYLAKRQ